MSFQVGPSSLSVLAFATVHALGTSMTFLRSTPRSAWLSLAGGVSVAYVFIHLLPELAEHQRAFEAGAGGGAPPEGGSLLGAVERDVRVVALAGLATFHGLDRVARSSARRRGGGSEAARPAAGVSWIHLGS